jgi:spoIIIJ-associated protein
VKSEANKAQEIVNDFLGRLGVDAQAKVFSIEEYLKIEIEGKDSSLLIGYHGENLRSLKHVLSVMLRRQLSEDAIILVDVSGYMERKEERIKEIAKRAVEKLKKTGKPQSLPAMTSFERRIAHSYISDEGFTSVSEGEGYDRHIVVKK